MSGKDQKNARRSRPHFTRDRGRSDVADSPELEAEQREAVRRSIEHLHGPEQVDYGKEELAVLSQVRNSRPYVRAFVEHYLGLGAKHLFFLDNGSTDGTVEILMEYDNVTVLRTTLPYRTHNVAMKQYLLERFGKGRWSLLVDVDELFDYPFSDVVGLGSMLGYLNRNSYTAVVAHMLDMFSEEPIRKTAPAVEDDPLKEKYRFYDVSDVYSQSYQLAEDAGNVLSNDDIRILRGGIRQTLFGNNAYLIKHPLIFYDDEIRPMDLSDHWVGNARVADFSGVLLHYKLSDRLYEDARLSVAEGNRSDGGTRRYSRFLGVLDEEPELRVKQETSRELQSVEDLVGDGFVVVSGGYLDFVEGESRGPGVGGRLERVQKVRRGIGEPDANQSATPATWMFSRESKRLDVPGTPELELVRRFLLRYDVEHLHGPLEVDCGTEEMVVLCLLRNGQRHVRAFVEHYLGLGAKHLFFLDNGSTDGTTEILKEYDNVTVLQTGMFFKKYQLLMRQYLFERFGKGHWSLLVDVDELFDYPFSDVVGLGSMLGYLNRNSYTAVVAHMLDMFSEEPIEEMGGKPDVPLKETHRHYELSGLSVSDYANAKGCDNAVSNRRIKLLQGGVQRRLFGLHPQLTKHPLVFYDGGVRPVDRSEHWAGAARVADFSGVLLHYKMLGLRDLVHREIEERRYVNRHGKYDKYRRVLEGAPALVARSEGSKELESPDDLIGTQFNVVSSGYMDFVKEQCLGVEDPVDPRERMRQLEKILRVESERAKQMEERNASLEKRHDNLANRSTNLQKRLENLERQNKVLKERDRHLRTELDRVRKHSQELGAALNSMRSSRSWMFLDGLNKIRKALTRGRRGG